MKKATILKHFHRPLQLLPPCLKFISFSSNFGLSRIVKFEDSCRYKLDKGDQADWNKLFGFCFGIGGVHHNSARFVWRYNPETDKIEIATYYYIDGQRSYKIVKQVNFNTHYLFAINRFDDDVIMRFDCVPVDNAKIRSTKPAFGCGLYFGGNRRAPHKITIQIEEL